MRKMVLVLICCCIHAMARTPVLVGIAGGTGSGKTTLANRIMQWFSQDAVIISQDSYYKETSHLSYDAASQINFDHPDSLDFALLKQHLIALRGGQAIEQPIYNFCIHNREKETKLIEPASLIIVEGILLFALEELRDLFDLKIFVDTDDDIRVIRRIERDMHERARDFPSIQKQYLATVKPMHDAFVEPTKQYADVIVPRGGDNLIALDMNVAKLRMDLFSLEESAIAIDVGSL